MADKQKKYCKTFTLFSLLICPRSLTESLKDFETNTPDYGLTQCANQRCIEIITHPSSGCLDFCDSDLGTLTNPAIQFIGMPRIKCMGELVRLKGGRSCPIHWIEINSGMGPHTHTFLFHSSKITCKRYSWHLHYGGSLLEQSPCSRGNNIPLFPVPAESDLQLATEILHWSYYMLKDNNAVCLVYAPAKLRQGQVQLV